MDGDFYRTALGRQFIQSTLPALVKQLEQLNLNLERLVEAAKTKENDTHGTGHAEEDH